jgi:hypothetical protein
MHGILLRPRPRRSIRTLVRCGASRRRGDKTLAAIAVHEANGFVSFTHVPVGAMAQFARALRAARVQFEA